MYSETIFLSKLMVISHFAHMSESGDHDIIYALALAICLFLMVDEISQ